MGNTKTRAWSKPELTVIVRGGAEESVLTACKSGTTATTNAASVGACVKNGCAQNCNSIVGS